MSRRVRARFSKLGKVRFTSHRDVARIWERALRRTGVAVAYTEGFSPRPKLSFGLALSTGYESLGEYLDISLRDDTVDDGPDAVVDLAVAGTDVDVEPDRGVPRLGPSGSETGSASLPASLSAALPAGIEVQAVVPLPAGALSLQQAVTSCTWHVELSGIEPTRIHRVVEQALSAPELVVTRERKGRTVSEDVRPAIVALRVLDPTPSGVGRLGVDRPSGVWLETELATQPRSLRPAELVTALDPAATADRVVRIHQWTQLSGARQEVIPLDPAATLTRTPEARAS
jgi:hypothetical protein